MHIEVSIPNRESNQLRLEVYQKIDLIATVSIPNRESNQLRSDRKTSLQGILWFQSLIGNPINCDHLLQFVLIAECKVSIPNRESNQLRSIDMDKVTAAAQFQSLIGNPINCDFEGSRRSTSKQSFNP